MSKRNRSSISSRTYTELNPEVLEGHVCGSKEFKVEISAIFLQDVPASMEMINRALTSIDHKTIAQQAHKLISSLGIMGMEDMQRQMLELENLVLTEASHILIEQKVHGINAKMHLCVAEVSNYLNDLRSKN